jgi:FAD synthase
MRVITWEEFIQGAAGKNTAATIGVFDGYHRGHQKLVDAIVQRQPINSGILITFKDNPKKVLHHLTFKGDIYTRQMKLELFSATTVEFCVLIDFSKNFGTLSGADFIGFLAKSGVRRVCVGPNFRCGHKMDTDVEKLSGICPPLGIDVEIVSPVLYNGHAVSSSRIRNAILEGNLEDAKVMLGRIYAVPVIMPEVQTEIVGRNTGIPLDKSVILPPPGRYLVMVNSITVKAAPILVEGVLDSGELSVASSVALDHPKIRSIAFMKLLSKG